MKLHITMTYREVDEKEEGVDHVSDLALVYHNRLFRTQHFGYLFRNVNNI